MKRYTTLVIVVICLILAGCNDGSTDKQNYSDSSKQRLADFSTCSDISSTVEKSISSFGWNVDVATLSDENKVSIQVQINGYSEYTFCNVASESASIIKSAMSSYGISEYNVTICTDVTYKNWIAWTSVDLCSGKLTDTKRNIVACSYTIDDMLKMYGS